MQAVRIGTDFAMWRPLFAGLCALSLMAAADVAKATPQIGSTLPINLSPGEQVTVLEREGGGWGVVAVRPVTGPPEVAGASPNATREYMAETAPHQNFGAPEGTVRFSLWADPHEGAWLKMENNLGRTIIYSAQLFTPGDDTPHPTCTICSVANGTGRYEIWPDDIAAVRITGFYRVEPGAEVCGNPENGAVSAPPPTGPGASEPGADGKSFGQSKAGA